MLENVLEVLESEHSTSTSPKHYRSCLFIPAIRNLSQERLVSWDHADMYIFDLEDGCPDSSKIIARENIIRAQEAIRQLKGDRVLRVNSIQSEKDFLADIQLLSTGVFDGVMLPMLQSAEDVLTAETQIKKHNTSGKNIQLHLLIETATALRELDRIASSSDAIVSLCLGSHDLLAEWNTSPTPSVLHSLRMDLLRTARAYGLIAIDTPFVHLQDHAGCYTHLKESRNLGFDGCLLVHPKQITMANTVYGIPYASYLKLHAQLSSFHGGCSFENTTFLGPPAIKKIKKEMTREILYPKTGEARISGKTVSYGLNLEEAYVGQLITCPYELTVDESWITNWHSLVPSGNYIETSKPFAIDAGAEDRILPFAAMINLTLCMAVEPFSETCILHLGMEDVRYEHPGYAGDTFNCYILIEAIQPTSDGQRTVVSSQHVLVNQEGKRILSFQRKTLFPTIRQKAAANIGNSALETLIRTKTAPWQPTLDPSIKKEGRVFGSRLEAQSLHLHDAMRSIGKSENLAFSTLFRNTHPIHFNYMRYQPNEIIVCGGFVMSLLLGNALKDLRQVVSQRIHNCSHLNKVTPENTLSSVSFIYSSKVEGNLETLQLVTLGLIELDAARTLSSHTWPLAIFETSTPKPSQLEAYLQREFPELYHKIAMHIHWEVTRILPE